MTADEARKALGQADGARAAVWYIPCSILFALVRTGGWPWWAVGLAAACVAVATFVFLRADTRYQDRRLARGDYRPWDLT